MLFKFYFKFIKFKSHWQVAQPGGMKTKRTTAEYYRNKKSWASSKQRQAFKL